MSAAESSISDLGPHLSSISDTSTGGKINGLIMLSDTWPLRQVR